MLFITHGAWPAATPSAEFALSVSPVPSIFLTRQLRSFMPFQQLGWSRSWRGIGKRKFILSGGHIRCGNMDVFGAAAWSCETHHGHAIIRLWRALIAFANPCLLTPAVVTCNQFFGAAQAQAAAQVPLVVVLLLLLSQLVEGLTRVDCVAQINSPQVFLMMNSDLIVTYFLLHEQVACLSCYVHARRRQPLFCGLLPLKGGRAQEKQ